MMRARILKPFRYSTDGITAVQLDVGDERDIADNMVPGLLKEGWIEAAPVPVVAQPEPWQPAPEITAEITDQPAPAPAHSKRGRK